MRLLFAFLLICGLALPAMAAPLHCAAMPTAAMAMQHAGHDDHHDGSKPAKDMAGQDCLGCATLKRPPVAAGPDLRPARLMLAMPRLRALSGHNSAPATPPPRARS